MNDVKLELIAELTTRSPESAKNAPTANPPNEVEIPKFGHVGSGWPNIRGKV